MNPARPKRRVFLVCVDAGTFDVILPWVKEGALPTFRRLMEEGAWGELQSEIPPITVNNIVSMVTGKNAGKHGVLHWLKREAETGKWRLIDSRAIGTETLWDILGAGGKRVIVLNVPLTYPPRRVNGLMVTGLLTPVSARDISYPFALREEVEREIGGRYPILPKMVYAEGREREYLDALLESLDLRYRASRYLMDRYPWDFFMIHEIESDFVQHFFWAFMDPTHPRHDPRKAEEYGKAILQVYQRIDGILAAYLEALDKQDTLMVVSDHGAGPLFQKFYTNNWLMKEGMLKLKKDWTTIWKYLLFRGGLTLQNVHGVAVRLGFSNLQPRVNRTRFFESFLRRLFLSYQDVDWERTTAFAMGGFGQIYIHGGKGKGNPRPHGEGYEASRDRVISTLAKLRIPGTQKNYLQKIYKREELYWGPFLSDLPDLVVMPEEGYLDPGDFEWFSNAVFEPRTPVTGTHRSSGIFLLTGPGIRPGVRLKDIRIYDIAPSILHLMGQPVPEDLDGKVLADAFQNAGDYSSLE